MIAECYPTASLPGTTRLYADYLAMAQADGGAALRGWYGSEPLGADWMAHLATVPHAAELAEALRMQAVRWGAGPAALDNIERLGRGARAVVTGQQVVLFGGPLLTLLKAATAVARAREASRATGVDHVPVFWLASEDHDLAEVDQVTLPSPVGVETLSLGLRNAGVEVGGVAAGAEVLATLDRAASLLGDAPVLDLLRECYRPESTLAEAFARLMTKLFAEEGLIVLDAASRVFHRLGADTLRGALEQPQQLEDALLARTAELEAAGYHAQVLVKPGASLLFLAQEASGERLPLRRTAGGDWKAGQRTWTTAELLALLESEPERLSPNALLRPVFQDTILPTAAYVGGPAEVAYFAQSEVVYRQLLGRVTPVLPRFSATLVEPAIAAVMDRDEVSLIDVIQAGDASELALRLGARAMPIVGKRRLAAAGTQMDKELEALVDYMSAMDAGLGRSAGVAANKMRYQMMRMRRIAARYEVEKSLSLKKHADAMATHLYPREHLQERVLAGVWFVARSGDMLIPRLVEEAGRMCGGHAVLRI